MANIPADHREYLERRPFEFGCSTHIFPLDEFGALSERGNWMEALASGKIAPATPEDEHFLQAHRGETAPTTLDERAWRRLKGRREFEREQASITAPEPAENYGIIEWDKEKCWW